VSNIECAYCEADCGVPDEPGDEGEYEEIECPIYEKSFVYYTSYSVDYYSEKAPCLNGEEHKWEQIQGIPKEFFEGKFRCEYCRAEETRKGV